MTESQRDSVMQQTSAKPDTPNEDYLQTRKHISHISDIMGRNVALIALMLYSSRRTAINYWLISVLLLDLVTVCPHSFLQS